MFNCTWMLWHGAVWVFRNTVAGTYGKEFLIIFDNFACKVHLNTFTLQRPIIIFILTARLNTQIPAVGNLPHFLSEYMLDQTIVKVSNYAAQPMLKSQSMRSRALPITLIRWRRKAVRKIIGLQIFDTGFSNRRAETFLSSTGFTSAVGYWDFLTRN